MTAQEAFELYMQAAHENMMESIFTGIKVAAKSKQLSINLDFEIPKNVESNLIDLGYNVSYVQIPGFTEKKVTSISWSKQLIKFVNKQS
jgi:hypothetical protein